MRTETRLLKGLFRLAEEGDESEFGVGVERSAMTGVPVIHVVSLTWNHDPKFTSPAQKARRFLEMAERSIDALDAMINIEGPRYTVFSDISRRRTGPKTKPQRRVPSVMVPRVCSAWDLPVAVLTMALMSPISDDGDCLANRISRCERCEHYFIAKTARPSRFCSRDCRYSGSGRPTRAA